MKEIRTTRENIRLDRFLRGELSLTQGILCKALRSRFILVNGAPAKENQRISPHDTVQFDENKISSTPVKKQKESSPEISKGLSSSEQKQWDAWLIYENEHMCVLNKPAGLAMQGGQGIKTSLDDMLKKFPKPYHLVHRLDRETSGVCVVAKHPDAAVTLSKILKDHEFQKTYWCITEGLPAPSAGEILEPIEDKEAITHYRVLKSTKQYALVECNPVTGRKHQIRKHMVYKEAPIYGDYRYNKAAQRGDKMHLHAAVLTLPNIWPDMPKFFKAPLPPHMLQVIKEQGWADAL